MDLKSDLSRGPGWTGKNGGGTGEENATPPLQKKKNQDEGGPFGNVQ